MPRHEQDYRVCNFDGTGDYVTLGDQSAGFTDEITVSCWVKFSATQTSFANFISGGDGGSSAGFELRLNGTTGKAQFYVRKVGVNGVISGDTFIRDGEWHHVMGVYDGINLHLYIDGVFDATAVPFSGDIAFGSIAWSLGQRGHLTTPSSGTLRYNGQMFDARVYQSALTADQRTYVRTFQASGTDPGNSHLHYKLDDYHATLVRDSSGRAQNGTKGGDAKTVVVSTAPFNWPNTFGYSDSSNGQVPRDESAKTFDVLGASLDYSGAWTPLSFAQLTEDFAQYWPAETGSELVNSRTGNDLNLVGVPTADGPPPLSNHQGNAFVLSGTGQYYTFDSVVTMVDDFTFGVWTKRNNTSNIHGVTGGSAQFTHFEFSSNTTGTEISLNNKKSFINHGVTSTDWNLVGFTRNLGDGVDFYSNGAIVGSAAYQAGMEVNITFARLGFANSAGELFSGLLFAPFFVDRILTIAEWQTLMAGPVGGGGSSGLGRDLVAPICRDIVA